MSCLICLSPGPDQGEYHRACLEELFGAPLLPDTTLDRGNFRDQAERGTGKMSVSGQQPKLSLQLSPDGAALVVVDHDGHFLIKPQTDAFPNTPENEHLSMRLGALVGIPVARCGLLRLRDGSLAYLTRRFDRTLDIPPRKLHQIDFCQLAGLPPQSRRQSTAEHCAQLARRYAADPEQAARGLFRQLLFSYWIGNGDLHLKNLALLARPQGGYALAPAYDLLCTGLYRDRSLTLPVANGTINVHRGLWLMLAQDACLIPRVEAEGIIDQLIGQRPAALALLRHSPLPAGMKPAFARLLGKRSRALSRLDGQVL